MSHRLLLNLSRRFHKLVRMEEKCQEQFELKWRFSACSLSFIWINSNSSDLNDFNIKRVIKMDGNNSCIIAAGYHFKLQ